MEIPGLPYVALYGSHVGEWRQEVAGILEAGGVPFYDPRDPRWRNVTEETGDELQDVVDELVEVQRRALLGAAAVLFYVARADGNSPAARFELGMLSRMPETPVFVHITEDTVGRNYLFAQVKLSPHFRWCPSLLAAAEAVTAWYRGRAGLRW